jgi:hypothetical protein
MQTNEMQSILDEQKDNFSHLFPNGVGILFVFGASHHEKARNNEKGASYCISLPRFLSVVLDGTPYPSIWSIRWRG